MDRRNTPTTSDRDDLPQATDGWYPVEEIHLPRPTYWPAVLALGVTFIAWSILTSPLIGVVGVGLFAVGLGGWIGDMLDEH
jgi:hypothetical protein